jgi:AsmA protein
VDPAADGRPTVLPPREEIMKTGMRRALLVVGGVLLLIVVGVVALAATVDVDRFRPMVESRARAALGHEVRLGRLGLSLFPSPAIRIENPVIEKLPAEGNGALITAGAMRIGVRLLPLLRGRFEARAIELDTPSLALSRDARGRLNVVFPGSRAEAPGGGPAPAEGATAAVTGPIRIRGGRLEWRDAFTRPGTTLEASIENIDLDLSGLPTVAPVSLQLDAKLLGTRLRVDGTVDASGPRTRIDLRLRPASVRADALPRLCALAGVELPLQIESADPLEIEARMRGEVGGGAMPEVEGHLGLRDVTIRRAGVAEPLTAVRASVDVAGKRITLRDVSARLGRSDLSGSATIEGDLAAPTVRFELRSAQADLDQIVSLFSAPAVAGADSSGAGGSGGAEPTIGLTASGSLKIEHGSFKTLDFSGADATLSLERNNLRLEPFTMSLYGGRFDGAATADLASRPVAFGIRCKVNGVDVAPVLLDNLQVSDALSGRLEGSAEATGAGSGYDEIARGLHGSGRLAVHDGRIGRLNVLRSLTEVSGVFGEKTLESVSRRMEKEGTAFTLMSATLRTAGGVLTADDLLLQSPDFEMRGRATLDLLTTVLAGRFDLVFSDALSRSLRDEKSQAAGAFWDAKLARVRLQLTASGPYSAPTVGVDWGNALNTYLERRLDDKLLDKLKRLLGSSRPKEP